LASNSAPARILIVDDFEPWRRFVYRFLQHKPGWQIICEASDGLKAIEESRRVQPDMILLDVGLPGVNGIEAAKQILKESPGTKILFLSENTCPDVVREALLVGGLGYVVKSDANRDLMAALEAVVVNERFVSGRFADLQPVGHS
jgi:DNA-binding NarL/FixJ family response regulator